MSHTDKQICNTSNKKVDLKKIYNLFNLNRQYTNLLSTENVYMFIVDPKDGFILMANKGARNFYGINLEDMDNLSIKYFYEEPEYILMNILKESKKIHCYPSVLKKKNSKGEVKFIRNVSGPLEIENYKYVYFFSRDITEEINLQNEVKNSRNKFLEYSKLLEGVLYGIPDIIGVYKRDRTVLMYNKAGYDFFGKCENELKGIKCYEVFQEDNVCANCRLSDVIREKKLIRYERFVSKMNKYIDCIYNPVLDDNGEVIFIIEQLRDITEEKILQMNLKESEEKYKKIVELSLDGIAITKGTKIVFANSKIANILGKDLSEIIDKHIDEIILQDELCRIKRNIKNMLNRKISKISFDYKFINEENETTYVEVISSCITYKGENAILSVVRDITKMKRDLNRAADIQKDSLMKKFPLEDKMSVDYIYIPAKTVSGDFFDFQQINKEFVVGILFDVSGKGFSAALNVSAFKVLFNEAAMNLEDPSKIMDYLNKKVTNYLGDNYVAASCFSLDFKNMEMKIVGGGISNFAYLNKESKKIRELIVKGPFLGMFEDNMFDEKTLKFSKGDKIFLFTDGMDPVFMNLDAVDKLISASNLKEFREVLDGYLDDFKVPKDDSTLISIEIE